MINRLRKKRNKMKKISTLCIFWLFFLPNLNAQTESKVFDYEGIRYYTFTIEVSREALKQFFIVENEPALGHSAWLDSVKRNDLFVTSASIVDSMCRPLGLFVNNGYEIESINTNDGTGNFYLKPNGVLGISMDDVDIFNTSNFGITRKYIWAIQSGPMLISEGFLHPLFDEKSISKHVRSGVGLFQNAKGKEFLVFAISGSEINFFEFASFFKEKFGCTNALNIESGRSVMAIPNLSNPSDQSNSVMCRYLIFDNR